MPYFPRSASKSTLASYRTFNSEVTIMARFCQLVFLLKRSDSSVPYLSIAGLRGQNPSIEDFLETWWQLAPSQHSRFLLFYIEISFFCKSGAVCWEENISWDVSLFWRGITIARVDLSIHISLKASHLTGAALVRLSVLSSTEIYALQWNSGQVLYCKKKYPDVHTAFWRMHQSSKRRLA